MSQDTVEDSDNGAEDGHEIVLTAKAASVIHEAFEAEQVDKATSYVRVGAHPGGCSGYKFEMDFAEGGQLLASDQVFQSRGIQLVVDRNCLNDILGSLEIDYRDGNMIEQGFAFRRLSSGALCGCGESFTPLKDIRES